MFDSIRATRGMAVAPHALAAQSALQVLREGGNALEAMIASSATIAVVYPHMNSIGGDSFWLMHVPGKAPGAIDASGAAAQSASLEWYRERGMTCTIPFRGGLAANTVAGAVSGWEAALRLAKILGGRLPLKRLLEDAIHYAEQGVPITQSQIMAISGKQAELRAQTGFADTFLVDGAVPARGSMLTQKPLAETLRRIARAGPGDFYRGELSLAIAQDLEQTGSPIRRADLARHQAKLRDPLMLAHSKGCIHNMPAPTQGLVALIIVGILDQLKAHELPPNSVEQVHLAVEATKQAFRIRDAHITDPDWMKTDAQDFLRPKVLRELAAGIDRHRAAAWGAASTPADTVWMGVIDDEGRAVSCIQSTYHEFGSGLILPRTGVTWQNRGCSFSLDPGHINALAPGKKPFQTLCPSMARFKDGRTAVYGTMGGDGQPQTQSALFMRMFDHGLSPQAAVSAPRWLLGRTWGQASDTLKLESRFPLSVAERLGGMGHRIEILPAWDEAMGHAGAIVRNAEGVLEGGADPRSDGAVAGF